jgi:hypothetical protein
MQDGGSLSPGQLLLAYPPFITSESAAGNVALGSVPAEEVISFHQDLARQLRELPDGAKLEIRIRPPNTHKAPDVKREKNDHQVTPAE